jgi:hypothetical protein
MKPAKNLPVKRAAAELTAHLATTARFTEMLTVINDGADDKFDLVLIAKGETGGYGMWTVLKDLPQQARASIPLTQLGFTFVVFYLRWRDKNGIGRFTFKSEAGPGKSFLNMTCWFLSQQKDPTIEEALLFGSEIPL